MPRTNSLVMTKKKRKKVERKKPSCKEHSCIKPRGTIEGFCSEHRNPRARHHDKK